MAKSDKGELALKQDITETSTPEEQQETPESPSETTPEEESPEKLKEALEKLKAHSSRLADKLGKAEKLAGELEPYRTWYNTQRAQVAQSPYGQQGFQQQSTQQQTQETSSDDDYEYVSKAEFQKRMKQKEYEQRYRSAYEMAPLMKAQAKALYPQAFEGVDEQRLDQAMYGGVQSQAVAPELLKSPDGWAMAAWQIKGQEMKFNLASSAPNSPQPNNLEIPSQRKPDEFDVKTMRIPEQSKYIASHFTNPKTGKTYTDKELAEKLQKEREERERLGK